MNYKQILNEPLNFKFQAKTLPTKGVLAWEYNPFRNYRLTKCNKFKYNDKYYTLEEIEDILSITIGGDTNLKPEFGYNRTRHNVENTDPQKWYTCELSEDKNHTTLLNEVQDVLDIELYEKGQLVDFETDELEFDLKHPVDIIAQESYDNSVNLIINDGKNIPRLINSRFSPTEKNHYQIVDRKGDNDTNIYDQGDQFDIDTSLYKRTIKIPKLKFDGVYPGGNLGVGNYHFFFKYIDSDGNETDWIAESGLVSVFLGNTPQSIDSGFGNQNSKKLIKFTLTNIDSAYNYVKVYYSKETSGFNQEAQTTCYEIEHKYIVDKNNTCNITISGFIKDIEVSEDVINMQYQLVSSVETQTVCKNMLFLGNVKKPEIPYKELTDLSLRFLPKRSLIDYNLSIDSQYNINSSSEGYYDPEYIYNYTGYWNDEIYRLGIVYILPDNSLSPVFNIRGGYNIDENSKYSYEPLYKNGVRNYLTISEDNYSIISSNKNPIKLENAKGVITLKTYDSNKGPNEEQPYKIYGIKIEIDKLQKEEVLNELKKYTKGFFFVRQKRIPTTLCQAISIATDKHNYLPVFPIGNKKSLFVSQLTGVSYTQPKETKLSIFKQLTDVGTEIIDPYTGTTKRIAGSDKNLAEVSLKENTEYYLAESFIDSRDRYITNDFFSRIRPIEASKVKVNAALCPEFELDQTFYANLFTGDQFVLKKSDMQPQGSSLSWSQDEERNFYVGKYVYANDTVEYKSKILAVPDSSKLMAIDKDNYKGTAGNSTDGWRFDYIAKENKKTEATNFIRGNWGPYLGVQGATKNKVLTQYDIKIPGYSKSKIQEYFNVRYSDNSSFYPISDRLEINDFGDNLVLYRGDCYICQFTHRMNRNFQDPAAPTNDDIVNPKCWKENYSVKDGVIEKHKFANINIGDLNAVRLGTWVTFTVRSTKNLCIRGVDDSHSDEKALIGHGRGFYPRYKINLDGSYKTPESSYFNKGFQKEFGVKKYIEAADVPAEKNEFSSRILYSNPASNDSYTNNFRVFELGHFKDYSKEYGSITKLVESNGSILIVFEHGIGSLAVNEKALLQNVQGDDVYIGANKVIGEPRIISDKFGSQWKESIVKTPHYIYGVDTVAKKIWRVGIDSPNVECISDKRIQQFLNQNITLSERELIPIIGIRNVKSHYNGFKNDVLFTFYDNLRGFEEKVWNICWNEITQNWTTLYSWVPSYSENIFNQFFTFDRNTSKWIAKLGISNCNSDFADGITLDNNIIDDSSENYQNLAPYNRDGIESEEIHVGLLTLSNRDLEDDYIVEYTLERDPFGNYKYFAVDDGTIHIIDETGRRILTEDYIGDTYDEETGDSDLITEPVDLTHGKPWAVVQKYKLPDDYPYPVILLNISAKVVSAKNENKTLLNSTLVKENYYNNTIAICLKSVYDNGNTVPYDDSKPSLMSAFWRHGQAGLQDIAEKIKPCHWYGKQHPFEFEFCVNENPELQKVFDNLQIISNNAEPDSFHYKIIGDGIEFANDKKNMYIRQESTKELYQYNGSDILYNDDWKELEKDGVKQNPKSTILPQMYEARQDTFNEIEDQYKKITSSNKNYDELTGTEVTYDKVTGEYGLWVHSKAIDVNSGSGNRLRGNMQYRNDNWKVQISPINFVQKNENEGLDEQGNIINSTWKNGKVPISIANIPIPANITNYDLDIPESLKDKEIDVDSWGDLPIIQNVERKSNDGKTTYTYEVGNPDSKCTRQQTKIRDKYVRIRIRYSGEKLALIRKIITIYSQSL